jgi:hypothetical protein
LDAPKGEPSIKQHPFVNLRDWKLVKEAVRNFVYQNFNPGLLPFEHHMRQEIFGNISSTAGLFLAPALGVTLSQSGGEVEQAFRSGLNFLLGQVRT